MSLEKPVTRVLILLEVLDRDANILFDVLVKFVLVVDRLVNIVFEVFDNEL